MAKKRALILILCLATVVSFMSIPTQPARGQELQPNAEVQAAITSATHYLQSKQRPDGSWAGNIIMASRHTSYYLIAAAYTGFDDQPYYDQSVQWLLENQGPEGTWGQMVPQDPPSLSNTAAAALALELAGIPADDPRLVRAHTYVETHGGIGALDPLVQVMYAVYGRADWDTPILQQFDVTALLVPTDSPTGIERHPPWWREGFVPLAILRALHQEEELTLAQRQGLRIAEEWLLSHQIAGGAWFTGTPTFFAIMAAHDLDPVKYRPQVEDGFSFLRRLKLPSGLQRPFELSVWDTAIAIMALQASGTPSCAQPFQAAAQWLVAVQSPGGIELSEMLSGGWSYNPQNLLYPDNDDTSLGVVALSLIAGRSAHLEYQRRIAVDQATRWLLHMQGGDGGWATFLQDDDTDNDADLPTGVEDPSIPDVTGHVLSALGKRGYQATDEVIQRSIGYLQRSQTDEGSWYGRWGLSYIYGTAAVLVGLSDVGADMHQPFVQKATAWLRQHQNGDGGWGEAFSAWDQSRGLTFTAISPVSTAEQTAWGLMGLLASGIDPEDERIQRAVEYLLTHQEPSGGWREGAYTVLGIDPYSNSLYAVHWPLLALGMYQQALEPSLIRNEQSCESFRLAHQGLPPPGIGSGSTWGPADLSVSLSAAGDDKLRLWIENEGRFDLQKLAVSLSAEGANPDTAQHWEIAELGAGSRISRPVQLEASATGLWHIDIAYEDDGGRPGHATTTVEADTATSRTRNGTGMLGLLALLLLGGLLLAGLIRWWRHWPLLKLGLYNLRQHRTRTLLTSFGVMLGTAAIGATLTLTLAFRTKLVQDFVTFGANRLIVLPEQLEVRFGPPATRFQVQPGTRFEETDVTLIQALPEVVGVAPYIQAELPIQFEGEVLQMTTQFVDPESYLDVAASTVEVGRFLEDTQGKEVVLGYAASTDAFGSPVEVGDKIQLDGTEFTVVGTMAEVGGIRGKLEAITSPDIILYAPLDEAVAFTGHTYYDGIEVRTKTAESNERVAEKVEATMRSQHPATEWSVVSSQRLLAQVRELLSQFTAIVVVISCLTVLVSGVGVANMMLVGVRDRTTEIGIMKALGARDRTILLIFLSEALGIGLLSACIGSVVGYGVLLVLQQIAQVAVLPVAPFLFVFSLAFSLLITLSSGTYPAYVAARLDPADAVRRG